MAPVSSLLCPARRLLFSGAALLGLCATSAQAVDYFWDDNGSVAGTTTAPAGTLGGSAFLSTSAAGTVDTTVAVPTAADTIRFVAGATAVASDSTTALSGSGAFTVAVDGTQSVLGLSFVQSGALTIGSAVGTGTINIGAGGINFIRYSNGSNGAGTTTTGAVVINSTLNLTANQEWAITNIPNPGFTVASTTTGTGNLTISANLNRPVGITGGINMVGTLSTGGGNGNGSLVNISGLVGSNVTGVNVASTLTSSQLGAVTILSNVANAYTGSTSVTNGVLRLTNATGSSTSAGPVNVSGATSVISGVGRSTGLLTVTNGGRIAPGNGISATVGTINLGVTGGINLTSATINFDLTATAAGTSDRINTASVTLGNVVFAFTGATAATTTLQEGTPYTLLTTTGAAPSLTGANLSATFTGFATNYTAAYSVSGQNLQVTFTAVPEPSTWACVALGAGLLGWTVLRRRMA